MAKFKISKKMSLDFLGEGWEDCYLILTPITAKEFQDKKLFDLADINRDNTDDVLKGMKKTIGIIKDHFVSGKGLGEDGEVVDIEKDDFEELPIDVLVEVLNFLSQSLTETKKSPSTK